MQQKGDFQRNHLAEKLRAAREYLGLSQEYVAQQTGIPRPAISEIEAGRRKVESLELKRLASLYGRPVDYFLEDNLEASADSEGTRSPLREGEAVETKLRSMTKDLLPEDKQEILRFAEYLHHRKLATRPGSVARKRG